MKTKLEEKYTKYEIARILGARSLQLAMDAPVLLKISKEEQEEINYDVLKIAERELEAEVLPITVRRPLPKKSEKEIKKLSDEEIKEKLEQKAKKETDVLTEKKKEQIEEKENMDEAEIIEMATTEDDVIEEETNEEGL